MKPIRESFPDGPALVYVGVDDRRVCRVGGRTGSPSVITPLLGTDGSFPKELASRNGRTTLLQYVIHPPCYQFGYRALHITPRPKALPDGTYDDTVAMAVGRKSGCLSYTLVCFLMWSLDRGPGRDWH